MVKSLLFRFSLLAVLLVGCGEVYIVDYDQQMDAFFYVDFEGAQMPVLVEGNVASGKFVVLVHGGPGGAGMSYIGVPAIEKLEQDFAVVYYNQRLSDGTMTLGQENLTEPSRAQFAKDLEAIILSLKFRYGTESRFYLMGHSWGGELITEFMATEEYQDEVQGMINVSGLLKVSDSWNERVLYMRDLLIEIARVEIGEGENLDRWTEILEFCEGVDTTNIDIYGSQVWNYGWAVSWVYLSEEGKITAQEIPGFETYDYAPQIANGNGSSPGQLIPYGVLISDNPADIFDEVTGRDNQMSDLSRIFKPSLIISGRYDCVVPPRLSEILFENISTPTADKFYLELDSTAHGPYYRGVDFFEAVHAFVEQY